MKFECYQEEGVKYYILVYPDHLVAKVYKHDGEGLGKVAECDTETFSFGEVTCPFIFDFSTIFKRFRNYHDRID